MRKHASAGAVGAVLLLLAGAIAAAAQPAAPGEEAPMKKSGLIPRYPADRDCSPLTSLFSSWDDVDGSKRDEPHTGVDGGRFGDAVLAPAPGVVIAVWEADWGWGREGALLIRHSRADLGLGDGPEHYYSEFDHLRHDEIRAIAKGRRVERGERLASVFRPGGKARYEPEVHWEVWSVGDDAATRWRTNRHGRRYWTNRTGHLIDPLSLFSPDKPARADGSVEIAVFDPARGDREYRGFTYILPCPKSAAAGGAGETPQR
jgi:murein DD-endopeptidase MepM/ murein hydrolase activator NlpD